MDPNDHDAADRIHRRYLDHSSESDNSYLGLSDFDDEDSANAPPPEMFEDTPIPVIPFTEVGSKRLKNTNKSSHTKSSKIPLKHNPVKNKCITSVQISANIKSKNSRKFESTGAKAWTVLCEPREDDSVMSNESEKSDFDINNSIDFPDLSASHSMRVSTNSREASINPEFPNHSDLLVSNDTNSENLDIGIINLQIAEIEPKYSDTTIKNITKDSLDIVACSNKSGVENVEDSKDVTETEHATTAKQKKKARKRHAKLAQGNSQNIKGNHVLTPSEYFETMAKEIANFNAMQSLKSYSNCVTSNDYSKNRDSSDYVVSKGCSLKHGSTNELSKLSRRQKRKMIENQTAELNSVNRTDFRQLQHPENFQNPYFLVGKSDNSIFKKPPAIYYSSLFDTLQVERPSPEEMYADLCSTLQTRSNKTSTEVICKEMEKLKIINEQIKEVANGEIDTPKKKPKKKKKAKEFVVASVQTEPTQKEFTSVETQTDVEEIVPTTGVLFAGLSIMYWVMKLVRWFNQCYLFLFSKER